MPYSRYVCVDCNDPIDEDRSGECKLDCGRICIVCIPEHIRMHEIDAQDEREEEEEEREHEAEEALRWAGLTSEGKRTETAEEFTREIDVARAHHAAEVRREEKKYRRDVERERQRHSETITRKKREYQIHLQLLRADCNELIEHATRKRSARLAEIDAVRAADEPAAKAARIDTPATC